MKGLKKRSHQSIILITVVKLACLEAFTNITNKFRKYLTVSVVSDTNIHLLLRNTMFLRGASSFLRFSVNKIPFAFIAFYNSWKCLMTKFEEQITPCILNKRRYSEGFLFAMVLNEQLSPSFRWIWATMGIFLVIDKGVPVTKPFFTILKRLLALYVS